jgi:hypothetical protein
MTGRGLAGANAKPVAKEFQGLKGPEPSRYGDCRATPTSPPHAEERRIKKRARLSKPDPC